MLWSILGTVIIVLYPLMVFFGLQQFEPRWIAGGLIALVLLRFAILKKTQLSQAAAGGAQALWVTVGLVILCVVALLLNDERWLRLHPVLINGAMLSVFALSLRFPPTVIERLARLSEPDLPPEAVQYTRRVTQVWCGFFVINGSIALYTALFASLEEWTVYNGLIAYLLMGTLFAVEYMVRLRVKQKQQS